MNCTFATKFIHFYLVIWQSLPDVTVWKMGGCLKAWVTQWVCRLRSDPTKFSVFLQENQMWTLSERAGSHRHTERPWRARWEGHEGHGEKVAVHRPRTEASGETTWTLDLAFTAFRSTRWFVYLSHAATVLCDCSPKRLKQVLLRWQVWRET